jgi:hypothetical protein
MDQVPCVALPRQIGRWQDQRTPVRRAAAVSRTGVASLNEVVLV